MARGHEIDDDTLAVYRCDEASSNDANYASSAEYNGTYDLAQATGANQPYIQGGPSGVGDPDENGNYPDADFCRWFYGSGAGRFMTASGDAAANNALVADWTAEGWIWVEETDDQGTVFTYRRSGSNALGSIHVQANGALRCFWEHSSGTDVNLTTSGNGYIPTRQWVHLAMRVTVAAGTRTVELFVNGTDIADDLVGTNASINSTPNFYIGSNITNTIPFEGGIAAWRIWSRDLTDQEIADLAAASTSTSLAGIDDADLLAGWHFTEPPGLLDVGAHGLHLRERATSGMSIGRDPLIEDGGRSAAILDGNGGWLGPKRQLWVDAMQGAAQWTFEGWVRANFGTTSDHGLFSYDGGAETAATNILAGIGVDWSGPRAPFVFWESGSGTNRTDTGSEDLFGADGQLDRHHVAVAKHSEGDGTSSILFYVDGQLVETLGPLTDPTNGDSRTNEFYLGYLPPLASATWVGHIDDVRFSTVERDAAEVLASYEAGIETAVPDQTTVVIDDLGLGFPLATKAGWVNTEIAGTLYAALFTTTPAADGSGGVEAADGNYARVEHAAWASATVSGVPRRSNDGTIAFPATAGAETYSGWGLYDAATNGDLVAFGAFVDSEGDPTTVEVGAGEILRFLNGQLAVGVR